MINNQEQYRDDEIDLCEMFTVLWRNKFLILAITTIFGITGTAYALLAPQVWSAKAIVVAPLHEQLEQLQIRLENLVAILNINKDSTDSISLDKILPTFSEKMIFEEFIQAFDSYDNKIAFLKAHSYFGQNNMSAGVPQKGSLEKIVNNISASQKKKEQAVTLSFSEENSHEALKRLNEYLDFVQNVATKTKNKELADKIANQTKALTLTYQALETDTLKRLQEDIARTEFALRISRTAGIEAPVENLNNQEIFMIDLGAKALNEKVNILKEIKNPVLINPTLADIRLQIDSLQAVPQERVNFTSYYLLRSPSEPLNRDKPKRSLVVVLAIMVGLVVGAVVALFRERLLVQARRK